MTDNGSITQAVTKALKDAPLLPRDGGGVELVLRYARLLDEHQGMENEAVVFGNLGPKLLQALEALGMTPSSRGARGGGSGVTGVVSKLDELRAKREQRAAGQHNS